MNSFKQALNQLKISWKYSLLLGLIGTILIFTVRYIPYLSAFALAFGILILQEFAQMGINSPAGPYNLNFIRKNLLSFTGTSLILLPTIVLGGSAFGILESPQGLLTTLPLAGCLFILAIYFYLILSHSLRFHLETKVSLPKAIDLIGISSIRNFRLYLILSFYFGVLLLISALAWGIGFIIALPLLFYVDHFAYLEIGRKKSIGRAPQ